MKCLSHSDVSFGVRLGFLVVAYLVAEFGLKRLAQLPAESYGESSILAALVKYSRGAIPLFTLVLTVLAWRVPSFRKGWSELPQGRLIRVIVTVCLGILAWAYSTYSINLYFNHRHVDARLGLVLLAVLSWWRPMYVPFFLLVVLAVIHQFHFPLGGDSVAE
ncbi:MAG: hypothetical protein L7V86_27815 [Verrucomicrobiales bacterium]|nr:hypothetical protein [Verrucomicrobiales bacterium]